MTTQEQYQFKFDDDGYFESCLIPREVGTCPCCDSQLVANGDEWDVESKKPTTIKVDCVQGIECFNENEHAMPNRMPYVYWLPLEEAAKRWVLKHL